LRDFKRRRIANWKLKATLPQGTLTPQLVAQPCAARSARDLTQPGGSVIRQVASDDPRTMTRPVLVHSEYHTRLFHVATRLLGDLFSNGTAQGRPLSQDAD
jgi:hypothetical protein